MRSSAGIEFDRRGGENGDACNFSTGAGEKVGGGGVARMLGASRGGLGAARLLRAARGYIEAVREGNSGGGVAESSSPVMNQGRSSAARRGVLAQSQQKGGVGPREGCWRRVASQGGEGQPAGGAYRGGGGLP